MPTYTLPFGQCVVSAEGLGLSPLLTSEQLSLSIRSSRNGWGGSKNKGKPNTKHNNNTEEGRL